MKTERVIKLLLWLTCLGCLTAQLDNVQTITKSGTTAGQFLKIGVDPRASAMGNAFTAMEGDISSMYWNPAGLAAVSGIETIFVNSEWLAGISFNYAAVVLNLRSVGVLGFGLTSLRVPEDKVRTVEQPEGTGEFFEAGDLAVTLSYAKKLTDNFSLGGNIKYIKQNIWHAYANTAAIDFGALFVTPFNNIRLGASISNYGPDLKMSGRDQTFSVDPDPNNQGNVEFVNALYETESFPLPLLFRVGLSGEIVKRGNLRVSVAVDALHPNDNQEWVNSGVELSLAETFFLRGGYSSLFRTDAEDGLTLGTGIHYRLWGSPTILKLDYSYSSFGLLKNVQRLSLGIKF
ncbi:MAG: PorV/PorQ family protein [Candidatus Neomarinimicrobiota bacterium]